MTETNHHTIEVNGINLYYEVYGSGAPLILLHGGAGTGKLNWSEYIPLFAEYFQVFVPDSRGHGKTNNPSRTFSYPLLGQDYAEFIHALELESPSLFGWSDGGQIALELGLQAIEIRAMVVGGAYFRYDQVDPEGFRAIGLDAPGKVDFDKLQQAVPDYVEAWEQVHDNWQELIVDISHLWFSQFAYTEQDIAKITCPALVLLGDRDEFLSVEDAIEMYRMFPQGELSIIPDGYHSMSLMKAKEIALVVLEFLLRHQKND